MSEHQNVGLAGSASTRHLRLASTEVTSDSSRRRRSRPRASRPSTVRRREGCHVITRSGSNAFHGVLFGYFAPRAESGWRQQQTERSATRPQQDLASDQHAPAAKTPLPLGAFNSRDARSSRRPFSCAAWAMWIASAAACLCRKLTWQLGGGHRLDLTAFGDRLTAIPATAAERCSQNTDRFSTLRSYGGHNQACATAACSAGGGSRRRRLTPGRTRRAPRSRVAVTDFTTVRSLARAVSEASGRQRRR